VAEPEFLRSEGKAMTAKSQTTRLFCASAFLLGARFWRPILQYLEGENHGVSPETGVDMDVVAQVCEYARRREKRFENYLFLSAIAALLVALANPVISVALLSLAATVIHFQKTYQERSNLAFRFHKNEFPRFDPGKEFRAELKSVARSALPAEEQNLIVYTGFDPFVGAGLDMGGWSFTVDISKPSEHQGGAAAPLPFKVEELYALITVKLLGLNLAGLRPR
jgi:hypothetical protein